MRAYVPQKHLAVGLLLVAAGVSALISWNCFWLVLPAPLIRPVPPTVAPPFAANQVRPERALAYSESSQPAEEPGRPEVPSPPEMQSRASAVRPIAELPPQERVTQFSDLIAKDQGVFRVSSEEEPSARKVPQLRSIPEPPMAEFRRSETPAPPPDSGNPTVRIPLAGAPSPEAVQMDIHGGLVNIVARDVPLGEVLGLLARQQGLNIITGEDIKARISITLTKVPVQIAIDKILAIGGYTGVLQNNILMITSVAADHKVSSLAQGRVVQVFRLDYTSATDINLAIKGLLSPVGQSFVNQVKEGNNRNTQEVLVVEDVPSNLERLARTIQQLDVAPRQVLIEAHILSVALSDDTQCGINLGYLASVNPAIAIRTDGFADAAGFATPNSSQAFFFNLASHDLNNLVSALQTTNNAKTLASPKVFAVNGQQAKIQIGGQLAWIPTV